MIKTRFAPSPTGDLHIGGVRTALFSWLHAKQHAGQFILRIEDTDEKRSNDLATQQILDALNWLGLVADEGPYYQSKRTDEYQAALRRLLETGYAYRCDCSEEAIHLMRESAIAKGEKPRYNRRCRGRTDINQNNPHVIRFKNPLSGTVTFDDHVQGKMCFANEELDDLVLARSNGNPTYHLSVVVDDLKMGITDIIRGDDHLNNTPRQINLFLALGVSPPNYGHVPLILDEQGKRLSKRHGAANILSYREQGYLPEALLNYLVRLGWSHGDQEILSVREMIKLFDIHAVNKSAAIINPEKLLWLNKCYLSKMNDIELMPLLKSQLAKQHIIGTEATLLSVTAIQKHRHKTVLEMAQHSKYFFTDKIEFDEKAVHKHLQPVQMDLLRQLLTELDQTPWNDECIQKLLEQLAKKHGWKLGKVIQPLRVAVTGGQISPAITDTLRLLGKQQTLARLDKTITQFSKIL